MNIVHIYIRTEPGESPVISWEYTLLGNNTVGKRSLEVS